MKRRLHVWAAAAVAFVMLCGVIPVFGADKVTVTPVFYDLYGDGFSSGRYGDVFDVAVNLNSVSDEEYPYGGIRTISGRLVFNSEAFEVQAVSTKSNNLYGTFSENFLSSGGSLGTFTTELSVNAGNPAASYVAFTYYKSGAGQATITGNGDFVYFRFKVLPKARLTSYRFEFSNVNAVYDDQTDEMKWVDFQISSKLFAVLPPFSAAVPAKIKPGENLEIDISTIAYPENYSIEIAPVNGKGYILHSEEVRIAEAEYRYSYTIPVAAIPDKYTVSIFLGEDKQDYALTIDYLPLTPISPAPKPPQEPPVAPDTSGDNNNGGDSEDNDGNGENEQDKTPEAVTPETPDTSVGGSGGRPSNTVDRIPEQPEVTVNEDGEEVRTAYKPYIVGYEDGTFRADASITREEMATILFRLISDGEKDAYEPKGSAFNDISAGNWSYKYVMYLYEIGVINGYEDGTFMPENPITRAEMTKMVCAVKAIAPRNEGQFYDVLTDYWAYGYIGACYGNGWVNGYEDGGFRPDNSITRAESVAIMNRVLKRPRVSDDAAQAAYIPDVDSTHWAYYDIVAATREY